MINRFFRALRALFGKLIGSMEDPAAILEQNIRDMNDQIPRMNENIAMVKANVTLLERDDDKLEAEEKNLISKMKAAIKSSRDDMASNYAVKLEQVKASRVKNAHDLKTATVAFKKSLDIKKAFLAEHERKTKEAMRAIQQARQAEWQSKVADSMESFNVGGIDATHDEMLRKIEEKSALNEAKLDMALGSVNVDEVKMEEEAANMRGMDMVRQMKMEMGLLDDSGSSDSGNTPGQSKKEKA